MDVSSIATSYAAFGGVLVGFAFAGLCIYVNRFAGSDTDDTAIDVLITRRGQPIHIPVIEVSAVAATGFYAMTSLGISTFLYANLSGTPGPSSAILSDKASAATAEAALLVYGVAFGLSVLTLFYFMTLMLFENSFTRRAAKPAFWAGTIVGSIVVLRFLAGVAQEAQLAQCPSKHPLCYAGAPYTTLGITITLLAEAMVFVVITLTRVLECKPFRWLLAPLAHRPSLPSAGVFLTSVVVATLASLYLKALTKPPPHWFISGSYLISIILIILFALASGSVIYPRIHGIRLIGSAESQQALVHASWQRRIRAWQVKQNNTAYIEYSSGFRPTVENGNIMWKVPKEPGELNTRFRVWHNKSPWRPGGRLLVVDSSKRASPGQAHSVNVTLNTRSGTETRMIGTYTVEGASERPLDGQEQPSASDVLQVAIRRLDSRADDVLLCWLEAGGTIDRPRHERRPLLAGKSQAENNPAPEQIEASQPPPI